ncbi:P-loop containing nucleoside triphosphate hydrolase protein [Apodospora peruviana]|uniref:P-loop containing nucleoside triphosphate hydrolase protein n=1 Tax=Apodospora peruviana TaxID=516989 RepID=A0AAE0IS89_9PEZI|nr:P-loop containing nucleoside triphosphate hydrolase protein [Apodospora peruviana]
MSLLDYDLAISSRLDGTGAPKDHAAITEFDGAHATLMDITERQRPSGDRPIVIPTSTIAQAKELDKAYSRHALLLRRRSDKDGNELSKQLEIQSKHIRTALKTVMEACSYLNLDAYPIVIRHPYHELFQYRKEIRQYAEDVLVSPDKNNSEEKRHLNLLIKFIAANLGKVELLYDQFAPYGLTNYELLWTYFRPETAIVYQTEYYQEAYRVNSCRYVEREALNPPYFEISAWSWDYNGTYFGPKKSTIQVECFEGARKLSELEAYPLDCLDALERLQLTERLIRRGKVWRGVLDNQHKEYSGPAWVSPDEAKVRRGLPDYRMDQLVPIHVKGRVIVDYKTHQRVNYPLGTVLYTRSAAGRRNMENKTAVSSSTSSSDSSYFKGPTAEDTTADQPQLLLNNMECRLNRPSYEISDFEALLAPARVRGYALSEKRWSFFLVEDLEDIKWMESRFEELAIEQTWKDNIEALVRQHYTSPPDGKSQLARKGRGLVVLLYGPPGTGKTLTAESIAELTHRPLYYIGTTDVGKGVSDYEAGLKTVFDLAAAWNAILLLDEADIFLTKRGSSANGGYLMDSIVAAFLRSLEYHEGIVFLTTNRLDNFDPAFESRLNLRLRYKSLSADNRVKIWRNTLTKINDEYSSSSGEQRWTEDDFVALGRDLDINGRQITNLVSTALAVANYRKKPLSVKALKQLHDMNFGEAHQD